jgi:putative glutamine amidotransferase
VTADVEPEVRWGVWGEPAALLPASYLRVVARAGGRVVPLPPDPEGAGETVGRLDGLLVSGGNDIDPALYGAKPHPGTVDVRPERDRAELALLGAALDAGLPVLGICRGAQLIAVAHGGALHQHLPEVVGHDGHRPGTARYGYHDVRVTPGSRTDAALGGSPKVASCHHQGIAAAGGLEAVAWAEDGSIEAVESGDPGRFVVGVQWHPEQDGDERLLVALVEAARTGGWRGLTPA